MSELIFAVILNAGVFTWAWGDVKTNSVISRACLVMFTSITIMAGHLYFNH